MIEREANLHPFLPIQLTLVGELQIAAPFGIAALINYLCGYLPKWGLKLIKPLLFPCVNWFIQKQAAQFNRTMNSIRTEVWKAGALHFPMPSDMKLSTEMWGQPTLFWHMPLPEQIYASLAEVDQARKLLLEAIAELAKAFEGQTGIGQVRLVIGGYVHTIEVTMEGEPTLRFQSLQTEIENLGLYLLPSGDVRRFAVI